MLRDMDRVLEEFGKWFLHFALAVAVALIIQPISKSALDVTTTVKVVGVIAVFLAFGGVLLYLSKRVGNKDD